MPSCCHYLPVSSMSCSQKGPPFFYLKFQFSQLLSQLFLQHLNPFCGSNFINFIHGLRLLFFCIPEKEEHIACGWLPPWPLPSVWNFGYHCPRNHVNFVEIYAGLDFCHFWFNYLSKQWRNCRLDSPLTIGWTSSHSESCLLQLWLWGFIIRECIPPPGPCSLCKGCSTKCYEWRLLLTSNVTSTGTGNRCAQDPPTCLELFSRSLTEAMSFWLGRIYWQWSAI